MKVKPLYIYLGVFIVFIVAFIIFSGKSDKNINPHEGIGQMPNDDIHKGMTYGQSPSSSNVTENTRKKFEELKSVYDKNPSDTSNARKYADMLTMAHQPDKAMEIYESILTVDSKRSDILLELTFLYYNKGDLNKAEDLTNKMLAINSNNPYAFFNLGIIAHAKGDLAKAKIQFEQTIKKFPDMQIAKDARQMLEEMSMAKQ